MSLKKKGKGFIAEFRDFIMRGNVIDMAVGVIIATAFGKITTTLVNNVIMPLLGFYLLNGIDLSKYDIILKPEVLVDGVVSEPAVVVGIGTLLVAIVDFIIIAFVIFLTIKMLAKIKEMAEKMAKKKEEEVVEETPKGPTTEELLTEILAEIKKNKE